MTSTSALPLAEDSGRPGSPIPDTRASTWDLAELGGEIRQRSPLDRSATEDVIRKHFDTVLPVARYLGTRWDLADRRVLEIGSAYGQHLFFWGRGSEGVEIQADPAALTKAMGYPTHLLNVEDDLGDLPTAGFDAIHSHNLIEHLVAPHLFLVRCHTLLADGGLLALGHPVVPPSVVRRAWLAAGIRGWLAEEHINFFTPRTIRLTLERSGFEVLEQVSSGFVRLGRLAARAATPVGVNTYSICRKRSDYRYSPKRMVAFDPAPFRDDLAVLRDPR